MARLQAVKKDTLSAGAPSPGVTRHIAFNGDTSVVIRSSAGPGTISGWHHHGNHDVYGYVVTGTAQFDSGPGGDETLFVGAGDFFRVPAHTVHRESNPSDIEPLEVILFLEGTGPTVVNVDGPDPA